MGLQEKAGSGHDKLRGAAPGLNFTDCLLWQYTFSTAPCVIGLTCTQFSNQSFALNGPVIASFQYFLAIGAGRNVTNLLTLRFCGFCALRGLKHDSILGKSRCLRGYLLEVS